MKSLRIVFRIALIVVLSGMIIFGLSLGGIIPAKGHWWEGYGWADVPQLLAVLLVCTVVVLALYAANKRTSERERQVLGERARSLATVLFSGIAFGAIAALGGMVASLFLFGLTRGARIWGIDAMVLFVSVTGFAGFVLGVILASRVSGNHRPGKINSNRHSQTGEKL